MSKQIKNLINKEMIINLKQQLQNKNKQTDELESIIVSLKLENERLKNHNRDLTNCLSKTKKMKNIQIETLNKIIKNLKQECEKFVKQQNQHSSNQSQNARQYLQNQYLQYQYKQQQNQNNRYLKRIRTQKQFNYKRNSQDVSLRDIVHQMRLQIADMKHSHIKMHEQNEKIHKIMRQHISKQSTPYQRSFQSQINNQPNHSFQGYNMGQCFMGRKSRINLNYQMQKPWARINQLNSNMQDYRNGQKKIKFHTRPQSQVSRAQEMQSWQGIQQKLNFIKEQNQQLKRPIFE